MPEPKAQVDAKRAQVERQVVTLELATPIAPPFPAELAVGSRFLIKAELPPYPNHDFAMRVRDKDGHIDQLVLAHEQRPQYERIRAVVETATGGNALRAFFFSTLNKAGTHVGIDISRGWQQPW